MLKRPLTSSLLPLLLLCLAACSGAPELSPTPAPSPITDGDEDGYAAASEGGDDCNDNHAEVHPGAAEQCNGLDDDCDGLTDEGVAATFYLDADADGYGNVASPVDACVAPPGSVSNGSDCDDDNPSIHPNASDLCDGIDQDCDGEIDEDVVRIYYVDADEDGYGDETLGASCLQTETSVTRGGDCDDDNASSYPAAPDTAGDGIDQSCDGIDGLAPSVGLPGSSFTSIQAALDAASDGQTVWVGPGTYNEYGLNMQGKALRLASTAGQETTILDGRGLGTVFYFDSAETETSSVEGFTVTGGEASCNTPTGATSCSYFGGGMFLSSSSPTLSNVTFTGNTARGYDGSGGGMFLYKSSPTLSNVTFTGNTARGYDGSGGGMFLYKSSPTLSNVTFTGNKASGDDDGSGGGMYLYGSSPTLNNVTFTGNTASGDDDGSGGGMYLYGSSPTLNNVTFTGNTASGDDDGSGGGMYLYGSSPTLNNVTFTGNWASGSYVYGGGMVLDESSPTLSNVTFTGNSASGDGDGYGYGGGMYLSGSSPTLKNVTFTGNTAEDGGGGMSLYDSSPTLSNVTFTGNTADYVGGMYLDESSPTLKNVILAYNTGLNLYVSSGTPVLSYTNLYQAYGPSHNLTSLPPTVTELEPGFVSFSPDGEPSNDDLHLQPSSPLRDAGDPRFCTDSDSSGCDPDGSLPDLGAYGGPQADFSGYQDSDQDGLYDSWELAQAGNLTTLSGALDADADGLSDADELKAGTSPLMTDSDADGSSDGNEVAAGKDPLNPSSVPGVEGLVALQVPSSAYPTLQAALNAIPAGREGYVKLAAGTLKENLTLSQKSVTVEGAGEGQTVLDGQQRDSVWKVGQAELNLSGVTVQNGKADFGGGMYLSSSSPTLSNVTFTGNTAEYGGGMYLWYSSPTLSNVTFTGNTASSGGGMDLSYSSPTLSNVTFTGNTASYGGGMDLSSSSPTLSNVTFTGNTASYYGGGMYLYSSSPTLSNVTFTGNTAEYGFGGGMYLNNSSPTLSNVTFTGNTAYSGGGMYLYSSDPTLSNVTFTGNTAEYGFGGGMYLNNSSPTLSNVTFTGNTAYSGGGMFLDYSDPTLKNVTFTGNTADYVGGMDLYESSPTLSNVILAYNTGLNLYVDSGTPVLSYTNLYQAYGPSHNLTSLPPTVTELEPGFVSFSPDGEPSNDDLHLQPSSPLRDAGDPRFCTDSDSSGCDPDGSLPDLGAYGGPQADFSGYQDSDQDGLYDSWELAQAGNLTTLSGALDADADGLSDADEWKAGTSPLMTDSDADGSSDGNEVAAGKDPLNPSSVPGVEGLVALQVPSSAYPTLQAALNAIPAGREGYVKLAAGTLKENLTLSQKSVTVEGAGEGQTVLDGQQHDSVWKVGQAELNLSGVTVQNGKAVDGGGMWLSCSNATLKNVTFTGNEASGDYGAGGGMRLYESSPILSNVTFTGNTASYGGGMDLSYSSPTLSNVTFTGNTADFGGGMFLWRSSPTLSNVTFTGNTAVDGGGMDLLSSSPTLKNVILAYNRASSGGNFYIYDYDGPPSSVNATTSLFYNPSGWGTDNLTPTGSYLTVEPQFLDYADSSSGASCTPGTSTTCLPADLHPAPGSPLIDAGDPAMSDVDGSRADIGSYGGSLGDRWDVDADGAPDYFWPGEWDDAPSGFDPADYDCDDLDPDVQGC